MRIFWKVWNRRSVGGSTLEPRLFPAVRSAPAYYYNFVESVSYAKMPFNTIEKKIK